MTKTDREMRLERMTKALCVLNGVEPNEENVAAHIEQAERALIELERKIRDRS